MMKKDGPRILLGIVGVVTGLSLLALPAIAEPQGPKPGSQGFEASQAKATPAGASGKKQANTLPESSANQPAPETAIQGEPVHGCDQADAGYTHSYASTCDGSPSLNGQGDGNATGKPCAGCVGAADNKNPKGQFPDGSDANNGYECDGNQGIGKTNPAHTGCQAQVQVTPPPTPPVTPPVTPPLTPPVTPDDVLPGPSLTAPPGPPVELIPPAREDRVLGGILPVTGASGLMLQFLGLALSLMGSGTLLRWRPRR